MGDEGWGGEGLRAESTTVLFWSVSHAECSGVPRICFGRIYRNTDTDDCHRNS